MTGNVPTPLQFTEGEIESIWSAPVHQLRAMEHRRVFEQAIAACLLERQIGALRSALQKYVDHFGDPLRCARAALSSSEQAKKGELEKFNRPARVHKACARHQGQAVQMTVAYSTQAVMYCLLCEQEEDAAKESANQ